MKTLTLALLLVSTCATAQEQPAAPAEATSPPPTPCATEQHRQFDFWVGSWAVTADGKPAGHNDIRLIQGGCALAEHWQSANGAFGGNSLNIYDQATDRWHQTWVDSSGTLLELDGGIEDGAMVLRGTRPGPDGGEVTHRITWTPNADGTVRQHWQSSSDGSSWDTLFDGLYRKVAEVE